MLVVLEVQFQRHAVYAASSVDLVDCKLSAVLYGIAINRSRAGDRTDTADNKLAVLTVCNACYRVVSRRRIIIGFVL